MSTLYVNNILPDSGSNVTISGSLIISQSLTVTDDITLGGNINLGDANTDTITITGEFTSSLIPDLNQTFDLGSTAKQWNRLLTKTITASGDISSSGTIVAANAKFDSFEISQQTFTTITASGGISASSFEGDGTNLTGISVTASALDIINITASTDISASGTGSFNHFFVSGEISGSVSSSGTGSFQGGVDCIGNGVMTPATGAFGYVSSSGDVSASGTGSFEGGIDVRLGTGSFGYISASGDISSSGTGSFEHLMVTNGINSDVSASGTGSFHGGVDSGQGGTGSFGYISCSGDISGGSDIFGTTGSFRHLSASDSIMIRRIDIGNAGTTYASIGADGTGSFKGGIDCGTGTSPATGSFGYISASGDVSAAGTGYFLNIQINDTAVTSTAAELNKLDGFTGTATDLNSLVKSEDEDVEADKVVKYTAASRTGVPVGAIFNRKPIAKTTQTFTATSSSMMLVPTTSGQTFTLPAPTEGVKFTFVSGHASNHVITTATDKFQGTVTDYSNGTTLARTTISNKNEITLTNGAVGDRLDFISDGTNWYVEGVLNDTPTLGTA